MRLTKKSSNKSDESGPVDVDDYLSAEETAESECLSGHDDARREGVVSDRRVLVEDPCLMGYEEGFEPTIETHAATLFSTPRESKKFLILRSPCPRHLRVLEGMGEY